MGRHLDINFSSIFLDFGRQNGPKLGRKIDKKSIQKHLKKQLRKSIPLGAVLEANMALGNRFTRILGPKTHGVRKGRRQWVGLAGGKKGGFGHLTNLDSSF